MGDRETQIIDYLLIEYGFSCVVLLCIYTFSIPCCNFVRISAWETMLGSSLLPVVCRRAHVLFTLFVFICI